MDIDASKYDFESAEDEARYEKLVGPPGQWNARREMQLNLLKELGLQKDMRFLDLGCGAVRLGLPLIEYLDPGHYVGLDVDDDCIAAANELIAKFDLQDRDPTIVQSTDFGLTELSGGTGFDRIWCFQVFIHLTQELIESALKSMATLLKPDGIAWATIKVNEGVENLEVFGKWRHSFVLSQAPMKYYEEAADKAGLKLELLGSFGPRGWQDPKPKGEPDLRFIALRRKDQ
jgi:SAM-dependent methyltransferase